MKVRKITTDFMESNCYILFDEDKKGILIDPGGSEEIIREKVNALQVQLKIIINTHGHIDHIYSNGNFYSNIEENGLLPVLVHKQDVPYLKNNQKNLSSMMGISFKVENSVKEVEEGKTIKVGSLSLDVIHTPGHTPGSICLRIDKILFTGDTLFHEGIGRTDFPGSSFEKIQHSIREKLFTLDENIKIYPGHGPTSTIGYEKENNPFVSASI